MCLIENMCILTHKYFNTLKQNIFKKADFQLLVKFKHTLKQSMFAGVTKIFNTFLHLRHESSYHPTRRRTRTL